MSSSSMKRPLPAPIESSLSRIPSSKSVSRSKNIKDAIASPYELGKANRQFKKVYPNRIYTQWYRRYVNDLPEEDKLDFQPFEEVQKVDEDIALQYFYGEDGHILDHYPQRDAVEKRRGALEKYIKHKENEEKERATAAEEREKGGQSRFRSIMKTLKSREGADFGVSATDKRVFQPIIQFLHKMQLKKRRKLHKAILKPYSKWKILQTSGVLHRMNIMYKLLMVELAQARFRKIIRLVACAMRFINVVRIISGSTKQILSEIEHFKEMQRDASYKKSMHGSKKMFDHTKYTFKEMHIPLSTRLTLTKPWFMRGELEIDEVLETLQAYKSFVQYPPLFQRRLARMAWYIEIEANKYIIRERHIACDFYVLLKGKAMEVRLVGDPYYLGNGEMKLIRYIKKSEAFGDESMSDPECQRDYSIISCEPCVLLAISVYDYNKMLHTKKDNEIAPEHIIFISHLKLFEGFPRRKLLEEGDENITIHYFRPQSMVTRNLKASNYVFVIIHGTCQVLSEMPPEKAFQIPMTDRGINIKHGKTDRHGHDETTHIKLVDKHGGPSQMTKKIDVNWLKKELKSQKKKHDVIVGVHRNVIAAEILDLQMKAEEIMKTLPKSVRNTFSMENFIKILNDTQVLSAEESNMKRKSSSIHSLIESISLDKWTRYADSNQLQKKNSSSLQLQKDSGHDTSLRVPVQIKRSMSAQNAQSLSHDINIRSPALPDITKNVQRKSPEVSGHDISLLVPVQIKRSMSAQNAQSLSHDINIRSPALPDITKNVQRKSPEPDFFDINEELVSDTSLSSVHSISGGETVVSQTSSDLNILLALTMQETQDKGNKQKTVEKERKMTKQLKLGAISEHTSISGDKESNDQLRRHTYHFTQFPNKPGIHRESRNEFSFRKDSRSMSTKFRLDDPRSYSRWKHVRYLSRGDNVGQEWLDFNNGPFEEPHGTWSLVSDGCEVIMIKKSFLLKYLRKDW